MTVYSENHMKLINTLCGKMQIYCLLKLVVHIVTTDFSGLINTTFILAHRRGKVL
jgi:hypothetical protein